MRNFKKATLPALKELEINYVKWTGNNFNEVRDFVEHFKVYKSDTHDIYVCVTRENVPGLYITGIGEVRSGDYIVSGNIRRNFGYNKLYVSSYKDLPYDVVGNDLLIERENIVYKKKDYWKEFLHKVIPFLNSDEEQNNLIEKETIDEEDELKKCPFCCGDAEVVIKDWDNKADEYKVRCTKCGAAQEDYHFNRDTAIRLWNKRFEKSK